jgi:hypothetical protein
MSEQEQRIAIAEACGWKNHNHPDCMAKKDKWVTSDAWCMNPEGELCLNHDRPDYLSDLNAMHEAEKVLSRDAKFAYWHNLNKIVLGTLHIPFATAAQRAEAFLKTIGKWEESK